ncbi:MAG: terminase small subunit [Deltaproteobacteria bacterium]|nr:terminase small subunit [Deltaproteobacteria bacterium]MBW2363497.1 terminase small subunit [Deltaproteobacteria bacterium]
MVKKKKKAKLSPMQDKFIHNLIKGMTQEKAYIKAGYAPKAARKNASRLMTNDNIVKELAIRKARATKLADVNAANIIKGIAQIAFFDIRKIYNRDGTLKKLHEIDKNTAAALVGVDVQESIIYGQFTKKIKMSDKLKALEYLAKFEGLFEKDNKQKGEGFAETFSNLLDEIDGKTARINQK